MWERLVILTVCRLRDSKSQAALKVILQSLVINCYLLYGKLDFSVSSSVLCSTIVSTFWFSTTVPIQHLYMLLIIDAAMLWNENLSPEIHLHCRRWPHEAHNTSFILCYQVVAPIRRGVRCGIMQANTTQHSSYNAPSYALHRSALSFGAWGDLQSALVVGFEPMHVDREEKIHNFHTCWSPPQSILCSGDRRNTPVNKDSRGLPGFWIR